MSYGFAEQLAIGEDREMRLDQFFTERFPVEVRRVAAMQSAVLAVGFPFLLFF